MENLKIAIYDTKTMQWNFSADIKMLKPKDIFILMQPDWKFLIHKNGEKVLYCSKIDLQSTQKTFQYKPLQEALALNEISPEIKSFVMAHSEIYFR